MAYVPIADKSSEKKYVPLSEQKVGVSALEARRTEAGKAAIAGKPQPAEVNPVVPNAGYVSLSDRKQKPASIQQTQPIAQAPIPATKMPPAHTSTLPVAIPSAPQSTSAMPQFKGFDVSGMQKLEAPLTPTVESSISQTPPTSVYDKIRSVVLDPTGTKKATERATAMNNYAIYQAANDKTYLDIGKKLGYDKELPQVLSPAEAQKEIIQKVKDNWSTLQKEYGLPNEPVSLTDVIANPEGAKQYAGMKPTLGITKFNNAIDNMNAPEKILAVGIMASFAVAPISTALSIAEFEALTKIKQKALEMLTGKKIETASDVLHPGAPQSIKDVVDILDFIGTGLLVHGINQKAPDVARLFTKDIITEFNLPKKIYLDPEKVYNVYAGLDTGEQSKLLGSLGLTSAEIKAARRNGITIEIPAQTIVTITDKPWFAKIKSAIGMEATPPDIRYISLADKKIQTGVRGELGPGAPADTFVPPIDIAPKVETPLTPAIAPTTIAPTTIEPKTIGANIPQDSTLQNIVSIEDFPPDIQEKANIDWEDNYAQKHAELGDKMAEINRRLKEKGLSKEEKKKLQEEVGALETEQAKMENDFVDKWNTEAQKEIAPIEQKPGIITDPADVQKIRNSIQEGENILKRGTDTLGNKLSDGEIASIKESVDNAKRKIGEAPEQQFNIGDSVKITDKKTGEVRFGIVNRIAEPRTNKIGQKIPAGIAADTNNTPLFGELFNFNSFDIEKHTLTPQERAMIEAEKISEEQLKGHPYLDRFKKGDQIDFMSATTGDVKRGTFIEKQDKGILATEPRSGLPMLYRFDKFVPILVDKTLSEKLPAKRPSAEIKAAQEEAKKIVTEQEKALREIYKNTPNAQEELQSIYTELDIAEAGYIYSVEAPTDTVGDTTYHGMPSTFPSWIPEELRSRELFDKVLSGLQSVDAIRFPPAKNVRQRELYNLILNKLDSRLGIDTKAERNAIMNVYDEASRKTATAESVNSRAKGGESATKQLTPEEEIAQIFGEEPATAGGQKLGGTSGAASIGEFRDGTPIKAGGLENIKGFELPEMVDLARELMGQAPKIRIKVSRHMGGTAHGVFYGTGKNGEIRLRADLFDPKVSSIDQAVKTLAHELGHLIDYLPDKTLKRGNLLGHLFTLRKFLSQTFNAKEGLPFSEEQRKEIRNRVTKEVLNRNGVSFGDWVYNKDRILPSDAMEIADEIKTETKKAIDKAIDEQGYIRSKTIRDELTKVSEYWRPYNKETSSPGFIKYRNSPNELYADAISVLFNSPGLLEEMAPTFYKEFFGALDAKPEVKDAYFSLQSLLNGDRATLIQNRRAGVQQMFAEGDYKAIDIQNQKIAEKEARKKDFSLAFKFSVIDKNYPMINRVNELQKQGVYINPDDNPLYYLEERNYLGGKIKAIMDKDFAPVYFALQKADIPWTTFGEALFYDRIIAGDRSTQANPRGITPEAAKELRADMETALGKEKNTILKEQVDAFRNALKKYAEEAYQEGLYSDELHQQMLDNPAYVTFQVLDHMEDGMTSRVHKSIGTLKNIANPADASILKMIATVRATERNRTTRTSIDLLKEHYKNDIEPAKTIFTGKSKRFIDSKNKDQKLITFMRGGKPEGYYVDTYVAHSLNNDSIGQNKAVMTVLSPLSFLNSHLFRPLFIGFNLGFQGFNAIRDFKRFWKNQPDMTFLRAIKRYAEALPVARVRAFGLGAKPSESSLEAAKTLNELEYGKVFSITFGDIIAGNQTEDTQIEHILLQSGIDTFAPKKTNVFWRPFKATLDFIQHLGNLIETLPKAAGYFEIVSKKAPGEALTAEERSFIRKYIGSPDFLAGGYLKQATNDIFLFSNAITQGMRSDFDIATNPKTRASYWWKTAKLNIIPKILMFAAGLGLFGANVKKIMGDSSEYDRTNYTIVPLGIENGKSAYLRIPEDEAGRLLGGIFWKILGLFDKNKQKPFGQDISDIISFMGGQVPNVTPVITTGSAIFDFISGQNPYDSFRGRNILSDDAFAAGGKYARNQFLGWVFNQMGGGIFYRFNSGQDIPKDQGKLERFFNLPVISNIFGRFVRVTDYGETERYNQILKNERATMAERRLNEKDFVNDYIKQAQGGKNVRDVVSQMLKDYATQNPGIDIKDAGQRLLDDFSNGIVKGSGTPLQQALNSANTNAEKIKVLQEAIRLKNK